MWGVLAEALSRQLPEQRDVLHLTFALADPERLAHLFRMAGFREVVELSLADGTVLLPVPRDMPPVFHRIPPS